MDSKTWLDIKQQQIHMYRARGHRHKSARTWLLTLAVCMWLAAGFIGGFFLLEGQFMIGLPLLILFPVGIFVWKLSTYQNRSSQLLSQLAEKLAQALRVKNSYETRNFTPPNLAAMMKRTTEIETRFLSNDDELFVKKDVWISFLEWKRRKRSEEMRYEKASAAYYSRGAFNVSHREPMKDIILVPNLSVGAVWDTEIPHRQGYKDSNTIEDEWAIMKALRRLSFASSTEVFDVLNLTSKLAQRNPVVFERYLRKKKISKKMKNFKWRAGVHYLSPAAKMRLVTFVESVLALEAKPLNEKVAPLLHEKNQQIDKYTAEFWRVHRKSVKFYWFEALWLLLLIPFIAAAVHFIDQDAIVEAVLVFTLGAALVAFGEMALVVRQKIKLNGKKLIPPLIAALIGSRHSMCADTDCQEGAAHYRRRFKNLEKHFIMTTPEIDSVKYVKDNLRDEERTSKLHDAEEICQDASNRMETYYRMFHLYRRRCLQYGALEVFLGIMLVPFWGFALLGTAYVGVAHLVLPTFATITVGLFEIITLRRHIKVWRYKEMYFKIYQGLSVLMVDGDLRADPDALNEKFSQIEASALRAICADRRMAMMAGTISKVTGLPIPEGKGRPHALDLEIRKAILDRIHTLEGYASQQWRPGASMSKQRAADMVRFRLNLWD